MAVEVMVGGKGILAMGPHRLPPSNYDGHLGGKDDAVPISSQPADWFRFCRIELVLRITIRARSAQTDSSPHAIGRLAGW
jgi:hypothetical protein